MRSVTTPPNNAPTASGALANSAAIPVCRALPVSTSTNQGMAMAAKTLPKREIAFARRTAAIVARGPTSTHNRMAGATLGRLAMDHSVDWAIRPKARHPANASGKPVSDLSARQGNGRGEIAPSACALGCFARPCKAFCAMVRSVAGTPLCVIGSAAPMPQGHERGTLKISL